MTNSNKPVANQTMSNRFRFNLDSALFVLAAVSLLELFFYRFLANLGFFMGVGNTGIWAWIANFSIFSMLVSGILSATLLFWAMARIINHPNIAGVWWRGILIFISPLFLLSMFWSVWTPLSNWLLVASLIAVELTVLLLCLLSIIRPVSFGMKRFFGALAVIMLIGTAKWVTLDFFHANRFERWGAFLLNAYEVAQFFMVVLPVAAFVLFIADTREKLIAVLRRPPWGVLTTATLASAFFLIAVIFAQHLGGEGDFFDAGRFTMQVFYRTIGLKLGWPLAPIMAGISIFFLSFTSLMLIFGQKSGRKYRKRFSGDRETGLGLLLVYFAGLQPFMVYQMAISLLGVILLVIGIADRHPGTERVQSIRDLHRELSE